LDRAVLGILKAIAAARWVALQFDL